MAARAEEIDSRALCLARETLAWHDGLADFTFAMQGLGSGAISLAGSPALKARILPEVARGELITAFALSEPDAGSDVAAMTCRARRDGDHYVLDGEKTWISNGGIADLYTRVRTHRRSARHARHIGLRRLGRYAGVRDRRAHRRHRAASSGAPSLPQLPRADAKIASARPARASRSRCARSTFSAPPSRAAALGFARRALDEALAHVKSRRMFGATLADLQLTQAKLGDMATMIDAAALLTYRAAWRRDVQKLPITREAAMAKMTATENAQWVIDQAVQLFGGRGVRVGEIVERLYREIRALRIYEGATEVQKLIVARELLRDGVRVSQERNHGAPHA